MKRSIFKILIVSSIRFAFILICGLLRKNNSDRTIVEARNVCFSEEQLVASNYDIISSQGGLTTDSDLDFAQAIESLAESANGFQLPLFHGKKNIC